MKILFLLRFLSFNSFPFGFVALERVGSGSPISIPFRSLKCNYTKSNSYQVFLWLPNRRDTTIHRCCTAPEISSVTFVFPAK